MADFVSQDRKNLVLVVRREEGVIEDDAFCFAQAGEIGVGVTAPLSFIDLKYRLCGKSCLCHEGDDFIAQGFVCHRLVCVEEWGDQDGIQPEHHELERCEEQPGPEPPGAGCAFHEGKEG